ncbi:MAG: zeta toxin family protein, partial [Synergistaceae bacterium]|nr:zeta toxin family protein [Synergistaceae bacterium]
MARAQAELGRKISEASEIGQKLARGEIKDTDVVGEDPVLFVPRERLSDEALAALDPHRTVEMENEGVVDETVDVAEEATQEDRTGEMAVRKSVWDAWAATHPEEAAALADVLREGTQGVTAAERMAQIFEDGKRAAQDPLNADTEQAAQVRAIADELFAEMEEATDLSSDVREVWARVYARELLTTAERFGLSPRDMHRVRVEAGESPVEMAAGDDVGRARARVGRARARAERAVKDLTAKRDAIVADIRAAAKEHGEGFVLKRDRPDLLDAKREADRELRRAKKAVRALRAQGERLRARGETPASSSEIPNSSGTAPEAQEPLTFKLTGAPVSDAYMAALTELEAGRPLSQEAYDAIPEIQDARSRTATGSTLELAGRKGIQQQVYDALMAYGSAVTETVDGREQTRYTGPVRNERRVDIIIGLPASGKSSALVDPISTAHGSMLIDSDEAKKLIPEFDDGFGAGYVHEESKAVVSRVINDAMDEGRNIVLPIVGSDYEKLKKQIDMFRQKGYTVHIHMADIDPNIAAGRNMRRFAETGRFVDLAVTSFKYGNKPREVFEKVKKEGISDGYSRVDTTIFPGQRVEWTEDLSDDTGDLRAGRGRVHQDLGAGGTPEESGAEASEVEAAAGDRGSAGAVGAGAGDGRAAAGITSVETTGGSPREGAAPRPRGAAMARVRTAAGTEIDVRYRVVDAGDVVASHGENGGLNEAYPKDLQPRQRGREASIQQIHQMAASLDPKLLGENRLASDGAPIVGPDSVVESGNGRVMAIRRAYRTGKADGYRAWLMENAERFGIDPADVEAVADPVLIRERTSDVDRVRFVQEANQASVSRMSKTEQALADAQRISPEMLVDLAPDADIASAANRQ